MFITFEGGEGSGKSTQVELLKKALDARGLACITTREPGGTESAERIRKLLVTGSKDAWHPISETLLFYAARLEHMHKRILPALAAGKVVLCDRFADSTRVYQGIGKEVSGEFIYKLHQTIMNDFAPDVTFILDIDAKAGLARAANRGDEENRFESMDISFHEKVRQGFLDIAKKESRRCAVIDASQSPKEVHQAIIRELGTRTDMELS